jgi:hypothetical protein
MGQIYFENFSAGPSTFTTTNPYVRATHGVDPLYPDINRAENVDVSGGMLIADTPDTVGGIWIKGFGSLNGGGSGNYGAAGFFDAAKGVIKARYRPTTASLAAVVFAPLFTLYDPTATGSGWLSLAYSPGQLQIDGGGSGGSWTYTFPYTFIAGVDYYCEMYWKCGTTDGYVKIYINHVLVYEQINIDVKMSGSFTSPPNLVDGAAWGFHGQLGPGTDFYIGDDDPSPTSRFPNDPCCGNPPGNPGGPGPGGPGDTGDGPEPDPTIVQPPWVPACAGGADFLTAPDPVPSEVWT